MFKFFNETPGDSVSYTSKYLTSIHNYPTTILGYHVTVVTVSDKNVSVPMCIVFDKTYIPMRV